MAKVFIEEDSLIAIGNAIRAKTGGTETLTVPDGMVGAINSISGSGSDDSFWDTETEVALVNNRSLLSSIVLPDGITRISYGFLYDSINLKSVSIPDTVVQIDSYAFWNCINLNLTALPPNLRLIGSNAFQHCSSISITTIPATVKQIGSGAFLNCTGITSLTFEGTPDVIAEDAFKIYTTLTTINVPWAKGEVANAPWGAVDATINYAGGNNGDDDVIIDFYKTVNVGQTISFEHADIPVGEAVVTVEEPTILSYRADEMAGMCFTGLLAGETLVYVANNSGTEQYVYHFTVTDN